MKARGPLALALLIVWLAVPAGQVVAQPQPGRAPVPTPELVPDQVPVVLVHGIRGAAETWGPPGGDGLLGRLARLGYRPGHTVFWSAAGPWRDPVAAARHELAPLLRRAAAAGATAVDIVAHTSGVLPVQHLLHAAGHDAPWAVGLPAVRQVIVIAPFSAGHDGAALAREAAFRTALLRWHWRGRIPRNSGPAQPHSGLDLSAGFDEEAFVIHRAHGFYEPAYHAFVRDAWFLRPPDDPAPSPGFWEWLWGWDADLAAELLSGQAPMPGGEPDWPAGTDLSRAVYERAAFEAARLVYHSLRPAGEVLLEDWLDDVDRDVSDGWAVALGRFLGRRLAHALAAYAPPWLEHGRDAAIDALFSGATGASPLTTPVRRLHPVAGNLWLQAVRLSGGWGARPDGPRVVSIGGRVTGPLGALLPEAAALGADPTLPWAPDLDDAVHTVTGWWGVDPGALARHGQAVARVVEELGRWERAPRVAVDGTRPAAFRLAAGMGAPVYLRPLVAGEDPAAGRGAVSVSLQAAGEGLFGRAGGATGAVGAPGARLALWAVDPVSGRRVAGPVQGAATGGAITLPVPAGAVIGVRLLPAADGAAGPAGGFPPEELPEELPVLVTLARLDPGTPAAPPAGSPEPGEEATAAPGGGVPAVPGPGPASPPGSGDQAGLDGLPLVRVVLHSRLTTDKRERREQHARWIWDFGDGDGFVDDDPDHIVSEAGHRFRRPGRYTVTARAESNDGRTIRILTWQVEVPEGGAPALHAFRAESIREPRVEVNLQGPLEWVAGRPAAFAVEATVDPPPFGEVVEVRHYPAERFAVLWERPGADFTVRAAVWIKVRYTFPEGRRFTVQNIYTVERTVDVLALGSDGR